LFAEERTNEALPSMAILEFLGEWETEEGEWIDPFYLEDEEIGQTRNKIIETIVEIDNEN